VEEPLVRAGRVGVLVGSIHLLLLVGGLFVTLGAAFGAQRSWAGSWGEQAIMVATYVLLTPLSVLNSVLPRERAPGYPVAAVVLVSVLWGLAAFGVARWREGRRAPPDSAAAPSAARRRR
jgi:hypothetical protein